MGGKEQAKPLAKMTACRRVRGEALEFNRAEARAAAQNDYEEAQILA